MLINTVLSSSIFGPVILLPLVLHLGMEEFLVPDSLEWECFSQHWLSCEQWSALRYCYGRISFGVKYKGSLKKRGAGFMPAMIGEKWMEGPKGIAGDRRIR